MPIPTYFKGVAIEDGGATLLARVIGNDAANITQASISLINYQVFEKGTTVDLAANSPLTVTDVVFDTLQTGSEWTVDTIGYNFKHPLVAAELPTGNVDYIVEVKFVPGTGEQFFLLYLINTLDLIGS